jgi:hypothetical protein
MNFLHYKGLHQEMPVKTQSRSPTPSSQAKLKCPGNEVESKPILQRIIFVLQLGHEQAKIPTFSALCALYVKIPNIFQNNFSHCWVQNFKRMRYMTSLTCVPSFPKFLHTKIVVLLTIGNTSTDVQNRIPSQT